MKQLILTTTLIFCAATANAQVNKQKQVLNFNLDSFNRQNNAYLAEQLKNIDTIALKNKVAGTKYDPKNFIPAKDLKEIAEKILGLGKEYQNEKFLIKPAVVDNMPIVVTTKDGETYTIIVHKTNTKPGDAIPK
jgi:hypothetical protein